ncbi:hypothetical protein G9A89_015905 [Geosiphon pyriformis]|nr:hypothetical protein G9A89_015905 [Geosiphon pyriformis]
MQLVGLWQKAVVEFEQIDYADLVAAKWFILIGKDANHEMHKMFTKPFLGGKTCVIDHYLVSYAQARCATVCFDTAKSLDTVINTTPVLKGFNLHWSHLVLAKCMGCEKLGHTFLVCSVGEKKIVFSGASSWKTLSDLDKSRLAAIYAKCSVPVACSVSFGSVLWAQIAGGSFFPPLPAQNSLFKAGSSSEMKHIPLVSLELNDRFAALERSLASLAEHVDILAKRLETPEPMVSQLSPGHQLLVTSSSQNQGVDIVMSKGLGVVTGGETVVRVVVFNLAVISKMEETLNNLSIAVMSLLAKIDNANSDDIICWHKEMDNIVFIFTESKLKGKVHPWIVNKFDGVWVFTSGLESDYLGAGVVVVMNSLLVRHVSKISKVPGWLLSIKLLFKNKLLVSILGLYTGASLVAWFFQAGDINSLIAKTVNKFFFIILGGNFNKNGSYRSASFKKCVDLGLVNFLVNSSAVKEPTWANSRDIMKMIDFVFVSPSLVNVIVHWEVLEVGGHFDMDHKAVSMSVSLGGLLNMQLISFRKQANKNHWKFNFKNASKDKWNNFKYVTLANAAIFSDEFIVASRFSNLDAMWDIIRKIVILLVNEIFRKKWFRNFNHNFTKKFSRFYRLELLVSKIAGTSYEDGVDKFVSLIRCWHSLDNARALVVQELLDSSAAFDQVHSAFFGTRKSYHALKLAESLRTKEVNIRSAIDKRMDNFKTNKGHTIRSVLEYSFHKVVLDHLVIDDELVLEPDLVKSKVDIIMESWTRKHWMVPDSLEYVFDRAFSGVMCSIGFDEFFEMVSDLLDSKAAGLSGISNKLWKQYNRSVLNMLLVLLNSCLSGEFVPKGVLTNTCPIALIETVHKILSNRIFSACSTYNVLHEDNFSVLKDTTTQSPIFAIGLDMQKAYNFVSWEHLEKSLVRIKICNRFICFFSNIHKNHTNQVMTNFCLLGGYCVHNGLDQKKVFFFFLWHIFYNPLLCEVKHQKSTYGYRINSYFISRNGCVKSQARIFSFFAAGAFVNNTIWVGHMTILINSKISNPSLFISGAPISITKKRDLAKAHSDVYFFANLVLKKAVLNKKFLYLVLAVLHSIVNYRTQFSFVSVGVCNKWDALICKGLKFKSGLKIALLVSFVNSGGILGHLFSHCASNNFLAGLVCIFLDCNLSLSGPLVNSFWLCDGVAMSVVLDESKFVKFLPSLQWYDIAFQWKRLDPCGSIPEWFKLFTAFFNDVTLSPPHPLAGYGGVSSDICSFGNFVSVCDRLLQIDTGALSVYTDGSLKNLDMANCRAGAAAFFENIGLGLGVGVLGLMSSTLAELQAIVLALKCASLSSSIHLFSDSQPALDACKFLEGSLLSDIDWVHSLLVWHPDLHMATGFTSWSLANACTYFMKALYYHLSIAVQKHLYSRLYPNVLCLYCGEVKVSDHAFSCKVDKAACHQLLDFHE